MNEEGTTDKIWQERVLLKVIPPFFIVSHLHVHLKPDPSAGGSLALCGIRVCRSAEA